MLFANKNIDVKNCDWTVLPLYWPNKTEEEQKDVPVYKSAEV